MHETVTVPQDTSPHLVNEDAVLMRAIQGDRAAFETLYDLYVDRVYAYLRARTTTDEDAADLTQQAFVQALAALPRHHGRALAFAPWLFRIARNVAIDAQRRRRDTITWDLLPDALQPIARDDVEGAILRGEAIARLHTLLRTLSLDTREILALRFGAGLTVAEVATVVGKTEGAVKQQLVRTMRRLRGHYHDTDD